MGGTVVFGIDKAHWREAGITLLMASPMHATHIFDGRAGNSYDRIPRLWVTGSPIYPSFLTQALDHFEEVLNTYGSIEAGIVCHQKFTEKLSEEKAIAVGKAFSGMVLEVVDERDQPVGPGDVGVVRYRTPVLTTGYIGDSAATKTSFKNGWFYPGDTGYLNSEKQLFITGRVNDLLNLGGTKLNAATVDGVIQSAPGITDGVCFLELGTSGFEKLSVAVVLASLIGQDKVVGGLLKKLAARFARDLLPQAVYIAETIPRNENGKVLRKAAQQKAQSGVWPQLTPAEE
jgi:acyl-coenzyme A synthetase/AMP-(fatty) acid ligase